MITNDIWHPGVCTICCKAGVVAPFAAFDASVNAPTRYVCAKCYLERFDSVGVPAVCRCATGCPCCPSCCDDD